MRLPPLNMVTTSDSETPDLMHNGNEASKQWKEIQLGVNSVFFLSWRAKNGAFVKLCWWAMPSSI